MTTESIQVKHVGREPGVARPSPARWSYRPAVDVFETDDEIIILADMPGAKSEDLELNFEEDRLTMHARVPKRAHEGWTELVHEFGIGDFDREFRITMPVDAARIQAELSLGTLTVRLPKPERLKPRRIEVKGT
jgi:HSP20 family molecular chaperone IbpA